MNIESEFASRFADYSGVNRSQDEIGSVSDNAAFVRRNPQINTQKKLHFSKMNVKSNQTALLLFLLIGGIAFVMYSREKSKKTKGSTNQLLHTLSSKQEDPDEDPLFQKFTSVVNSKKKSIIE